MAIKVLGLPESGEPLLEEERFAELISLKRIYSPLDNISVHLLSRIMLVQYKSRHNGCVFSNEIFVRRRRVHVIKHLRKSSYGLG